MSNGDAYQGDLAYIHDQGFGEFARGSAPGLLQLFQRHGITGGLIVDLGCGSGIWANALSDAGYQVIGVDISPAMIELAQQRAPNARFQVGSFVPFHFPPCRAVTALGEVFNYLFDPNNSLRTLRRVFQAIFERLAPDGLLIFDVAEPGRCKGFGQRVMEGDDWACLVEYRNDVARGRLTRRIVSFRKVGDTYRRREETHVQQLIPATTPAEMLRSIGFRVRLLRRYGDHPLPKKSRGIVARKP